MGAAYKGRSPNKPMITTWPIKVELQIDESISSWLVRCALENGCDPLVLTSSVWPRWRVWTTDVDRGLSEERIDKLSLYSGVEQLNIRSASLSDIGKLMTSVPLKKNGLWPWVLGLGVRNRRLLNGYQFCPLCFSEDSRSYLRRSWRLSWHVGCMLHGVLMESYCRCCGKPYEPQRLEAIKTVSLAMCASCGSDLTSQCADSIDRHSMIDFQRRSEDVFRDGGGYIGGNWVGDQDWFDSCRFLVGLLRRAVSTPNSILGEALKSVGVDIQKIKPDDLDLQFELLRLSSRAEVLQCLSQLLINLHDFAESLESKGGSINSIWDKQKRIPSSLKLSFDNLPHNGRGKKTRTYQKVHKPKSKIAVARAWSRLKRMHDIE